MKIIIFPDKSTKFCHARPGQVIQLLSEPESLALPVFYLLAVVPGRNEGKKQLGSDGLYGESRELQLIELATGRICPIPHMSSQIIIHHNAFLGFTE